MAAFRSKNRGRFRGRGWAAGLAALAVFGLVVAGPMAQTVPRIKAKGGIQIPQFDAKNRLKSLLKLKTARPVEHGLVYGTGLHGETYSYPGGKKKVDMIFDAPHCWFNYSDLSVFSDSRLRVRSGDGKLLIEGKGFLWRQKDSDLIISNAVHTVIRGTQ